MTDGAPDIASAIAELAERVPDPLAPLARVAFNYRWSWHPDGPSVFEDVDPARWRRSGRNPIRLLQETSRRSLEAAAADAGLIERAEQLERDIQEELDAPPADVGIDPEHPVAFFCAEYAIHISLPVYSGGLGALAGDLVKEASDRRLPFVAVGLMYHQGYFRQRIDAAGWQHEYWIDTDPERVPAALVTAEGGEPLTIAVPIGERDISAYVWRVNVGRVPLYLLDTNHPDNDARTRWISYRLYVGDAETRLEQYVVLGVGGVRALGAMGIEPGTLHLNEGHAALAPIELAAEDVSDGGSPKKALENARARTVFTTHTPVPAGNDSYPAEQVKAAIINLADDLAVAPEEIISLGRTDPSDVKEEVGVTQLALRMSRAAGGVSRRHGEVAREMWRALWPGSKVDSVPIGYVTNGVHLPTWVGPPLRALLDRHLGDGWIDRAADPATWEPIDSIPDEELWGVREEQRSQLVDFARERSVMDRLARDDSSSYVDAARNTFDPGVLTLGFARRVATYKRLGLLTHDPERTLELLGGERPVQVILAGKAHPRDDDAKRVLQALFRLKGAPLVGERVIFLDDYDLDTAARLVRGCDVWVNLPRPPLEASGTSGMKSAVNGGLQLSVLDGWWAEGFHESLGWALSGEPDPDEESQDTRDSAELYRLLEEEVVPAFADRTRWLDRVAASIATVGAHFGADRMVRDYADGYYLPAHRAR